MPFGSVTVMPLYCGYGRSRLPRVIVVPVMPPPANCGMPLKGFGTAALR